MSKNAAPTALTQARALIWRMAKHDAPAHLIRFEKATEPDQWRVLYRRARYSEAGPTLALVPRISLTSQKVQEARRWLADLYSPGGIPW